MSAERDRLTSELREIEKNGYDMEDVQKQRDYMSVMLRFIGDADPEFRDLLIYNTLYEWIEVRDYFDAGYLKSVLSVLMDDEHLFFQIGSDGSDSVFTRTFSALGIALILCRHRKKAFLDIREFTQIKDRLISYYTSEKDLRGYIGEAGWAHGAAHGADMMDELVQCRESNAEVVGEILSAFKKVLYNGKYIFHNEDDERIGRVVFRIIKNRLLSRQDIAVWFESLSVCNEWNNDRAKYVARVNAKNLIRCVYFKMMHYDNKSDAVDMIFKAEEKLNRFLQVDKELIKA